MRPPEVLVVEYQKNAKYVVADELHGGMGTVFKLFPVAEDSPTIAMKTIRGNSSIKSFDIECEAWFSIAHHPNVARPLAFGSWKSLPSVLIEWYPQSLSALNSDRLDGSSLQRLIAETVAALQFASSEKGLIHQDIKPANILIDKTGKARLSDFGLARCLVSSSQERIRMWIGNVPQSTSKGLSGTPYFMAPELWDGETPSIRTDIFSLGVTFYHFLTKEHPFIEDDRDLRISKVVRLKKLFEALGPKGSEGDQIAQFITKCLALDPQQRFHSYQNMLSDCSWLRTSDIANDWSIERSEVVASTAQFFRAKGDNSKALLILEETLRKRPKDIVLIEEMARLYSATGQTNEAKARICAAFNNLKSSHGLYEGRFFPRPALAWARERIHAGCFEQAAAIVKEVLAWERNNSHVTGAAQIIGSGLFAEIGWYLLYMGDFSGASTELFAYAARHSLDKLESIWAVEAAWLSRAIRIHADELSIKVLENMPDRDPGTGGKEFVWAGMVLRGYANPLLCQDIWNKYLTSFLVELEKLGKESGLAMGLTLPSECVSHNRL